MTCATCKNFLDDNALYSRSLDASNGAISRHYWCQPYSDIREVIIRAKYKAESSHYKHVVAHYRDSIRNMMSREQIDLIIPVPTQDSHISTRGRDHTTHLAKLISGISGVKYKENILIPGRSFVQVSSERKARIAGPYYLFNSRLKSGSVLLVDDVASTFSSLNACANAISRSSDVKIVSFTISLQNLSDHKAH